MNFLNARTPASTRPGGLSGTPGGGSAADGLSKRGVELTMYREAPCGEVSIEEFEKYALDRLRGEDRAGGSSSGGWAVWCAVQRSAVQCVHCAC
jgi:hypothetical protein